MISRVSICSNALLLLGAQPIHDLDEDTDRARLASSLYPLVRDNILRSHPWSCAVKRVTLSPDASTPPYGYAYQFPLPGDWLRTLSVGEYGNEIDYRIEGRALLANSNTIKLRYIYRNEDEPTWDSMLVHSMTVAMAAYMAYAITQSASLEQMLYEKLQHTLRQARTIDGIEEPPEQLGDFRLLRSRH